MNAELAARRTAAGAVLAGYAEVCTSAPTSPTVRCGPPASPTCSALLLAGLGDGPAGCSGEQLEEIRLVLEAFDWETADRQFALEADRAASSHGDGR